ncbi:MAG: hypothetical protein IJ685_13255 [Selenomonadaceae bacterium]|nr:hypothetical protein [Selenomonadaceae bacterium]
MAEFVFNLQRFSDSSGSKGGDSGSDGNKGGNGGSGGGSGGNKVYTGYSNTGHVLPGTTVGSSSGWETRVRKNGEIIFPLFMSVEEAEEFAETAWYDYRNNVEVGTASYYNYADGIPELIDYSRFLSGHVWLDNDAADVINLVDSTVGNLVEYFTFKDDNTSLALVFDTGTVLDFDINYVSPIFNFYNGEQMMYSTIHERWLNGSEIAQTQSFWAGALIFSASEGVDTLYVSRATNNALLNVSDNDAVVLTDVDSDEAITLSQVTDENIIFTFTDGKQLVVENDTNWSPTFYFADGNVQYYNRDLGIWSDPADKAADDALYQSIKAQEELEAAAEAAANKLAFEELAYETGFDVVTDATDYAEATVFPVTNFAETLVYNTSYDNTISMYDTLPVNVVAVAEDVDYINILFNTGEMLSVGYDYNFSPTFRFANGYEIGYNYRTDTWGTAYRATDEVAEEANLSVYENSLVYQAGWEDTIYFYDGTAYNLTNVSANDYYIDFTFNTGATVSVRYTDSASPDFVFGDDPTVHYYYNYDYGWSSYDTDDLSTSADLWGDAPVADGILDGGAIASDATLSDLVAAPVDSAAVSFNAESAFDINAAGGFVAASAAATSTEQKDA